MNKYKIGVFVGSLRKKSYTRMVGDALKKLAPETLDMYDVEFGNLPLYNQDFDDEGNAPKAWNEFREFVKGCDGFLFLTPEYNRAMPAALKNALDVGSRPWGKSVWDGKPGAVVSVSPGALGAYGANHSVRSVLVCLNIPTMQQPEAYIGNLSSFMDSDGNITNAGTEKFFAEFMDSFAKWVEKNSGN